jgi:hypothetical protein
MAAEADRIKQCRSVRLGCEPGGNQQLPLLSRERFGFALDLVFFDHCPLTLDFNQHPRKRKPETPSQSLSS